MPLIRQVAATASTLDVAARDALRSACTGACMRNWKVLFAAVLFAEGLLFGHLVFLMRHMVRGKRALAALSHFGHAVSAGVFFATGMLHILPEAVHLLAAADGDEDDHGEEGEGFPWPYFIVVVAFYAIFFLEKIVIPKVLPNATDPCGELHATASDMKQVDEDDPLDPPPHSITQGFASAAFATALLQMLGLSVHSVLESLALGLSGDWSTLLHVFLATAAHRWATSLAISFTLVARLRYAPFLVALTLFSAMVPLGVGIAAAFSALAPIAKGTLFAVSAATFLYIGAFDAMADEFVLTDKWRGRKFCATVAGASVIAGVTGLLIGLDLHG